MSITSQYHAYSKSFYAYIKSFYAYIKSFYAYSKSFYAWKRLQLCAYTSRCDISYHRIDAGNRGKGYRMETEKCMLLLPINIFLSGICIFRQQYDTSANMIGTILHPHRYQKTNSGRVAVVVCRDILLPHKSYNNLVFRKIQCYILL